MSIARMPVGIEFSIARRKFVSWISAPWICKRLRMWRQVPSSIQTVSTDSATTIQNSVLPIRPIEVRQPCPRSSRPLSDGVNGASLKMSGARRATWPGMAVKVAATTSFLASSTIEILCRCATSAGTKWRSSDSIEYSTISAPRKVLRSTSGTWSSNTAAPVPSSKARE